ncbi:MAG TPA: isoprenyl transferase, partial [Coriobacteriia bacterium]|nr:isoprenyl transferase [Coriobacteriia bacterium]
DSGLLSEFDPAHAPRHIAVIMDGNGRWAAARGLPRIAGHRAGAKAVRELIAASLELGIEYVTIYSFSSENWSRPVAEVRGLMRLFIEVLERETADLEAMDVRVLLAGDLSGLPADTAAALHRTVDRTSGNTSLTLVVALNYGGRDEIVRAVRSIASRVASGNIAPDDIDESTVTAHLYLPDVPDPDLLVRTSGELRVSNFLLWQIAYTELYVTDTLWPDFDRHDLLRAVNDYAARDRRYGGR